MSKRDKTVTKKEQMRMLSDLLRKTTDPNEAVKLTRQINAVRRMRKRSKTIAAKTDRPQTSSAVLWKPEDLLTITPDATPHQIAHTRAVNAFIQSNAFWSMGPDGNRWGPEMRRQGRWIGIVDGPPFGEWEELEVARKLVKCELCEAPPSEGTSNTKPDVSASQREADAANADILRENLNLTEPDTVEQPEDGLSFEVKEAMEKHRRKMQEIDDEPDIIL